MHQRLWAAAPQQHQQHAGEYLSMPAMEPAVTAATPLRPAGCGNAHVKFRLAAETGKSVHEICAEYDLSLAEAQVALAYYYRLRSSWKSTRVTLSGRRHAAARHPCARSFACIDPMRPSIVQPNSPSFRSALPSSRFGPLSSHSPKLGPNRVAQCARLVIERNARRRRWQPEP